MLFTNSLTNILLLVSLIPQDQESSEHIVEKIVDVREKRGKITVRIRWKGCNEKQDTWEPRENLNEGACELKRLNTCSRVLFGSFRLILAAYKTIVMIQGRKQWS